MQEKQTPLSVFWNETSHDSVDMQESVTARCEGTSHGVKQWVLCEKTKASCSDHEDQGLQIGFGGFRGVAPDTGHARLVSPRLASPVRPRHAILKTRSHTLALIGGIYMGVSVFVSTSDFMSSSGLTLPATRQKYSVNQTNPFESLERL